MPFGNIYSTPNNNQKQLATSYYQFIRSENLFYYYNLALLQMCNLLWFGVAGTVALNELKSVTEC